MAGIGLTHRHQLRVIYAHTDRMNVVYYSRYFEYFEAARAAFLRRIGIPFEQLEQQGYYLPVVESHCNYLSPATYGDLVTIVTRLDQEPTAKIRLDYLVYRDDEEQIIAKGYTVHSFVNQDLRPVRAPDVFMACVHRHAGQALEGEDVADDT